MSQKHLTYSLQKMYSYLCTTRELSRVQHVPSYDGIDVAIPCSASGPAQFYAENYPRAYRAISGHECADKAR